MKMLDFAHATAFTDERSLIMLMVVLIAGIIRGFTGFGSALLAVPALATIYGPVEAVVIEVLIEIPVCLTLLHTAIKRSERQTIFPMIAMFIVFVPVGALLLTITNPATVKVLISLFVLAALALIWQQPRVTRIFSPKFNYIVGAISGITQGLTGMAGPLFATALIARGDSSTCTRANISALALAIIFLSVASFALVGLITKTLVLYAILASPAIMLGVWIGSFLFSRFGELKLRVVILYFLAFTALITLFQTLFC